MVGFSQWLGVFFGVFCVCFYFCFFAFTCNTKKLCNSLYFFSLFFTFFIFLFFGQTSKSYLLIFYHSLPTTHVARIGLLSLNTKANVFTKATFIVKFGMFKHEMPYALGKIVMAELSEQVNKI